MNDSENDLGPQAERKSILRNALEAIDSLQTRLDTIERDRQEPIAIVGLSCRFPGAPDEEAYWQLLQQGKNAVREVPDDRWDKQAFFHPDPTTPGKMHASYGGFLEDIDLFDPAFFGISGREAETMDPQQRLLLEATWAALENAGIQADQLRGTQGGVFIGITTSDYCRLAVARDVSSLDVYTATGGALNVAAGRIAYTLGLNGPAAAIDTACSSSLVAVHLACQSLRNKECDLVLAGGVNILLSPEPFICFAKWGMMAPDGQCKTFDEKADGFVRAEGCGVIVLKRLSDAQAAGDRVLALIRGTAVNQDGASSGLTVPNGLAQQAVIRAAMKSAGVQPGELDYVEAHGTGTTLGDPIELEAIAAVLGRNRPDGRPLQVGSVKTNIGHTESASGIAGLIKVVLSMQHALIPPHINFKKLSPRISLGKAHIEIPVSAVAWPQSARPRLAGVSSFGFSGTNAHVILQDAPPPAAEPAASPADRPAHLLVLSARSTPALQELAQAYVKYFSGDPSANLADVCLAAAAGRAALPHRLALVAANVSTASAALDSFARGTGGAEIITGKAKQAPRVAFLFTGQGAQYPGMARTLYATEPVYRTAFDACASLLSAELDRPLADLVGYTENPVPAEVLNETRYTQPALFAVEYALAALWRSWGVEPSAVIGHSLGEYVAACVAGVLSLEDALHLVVVRSRLMQALPRDGAMLAVLAPENEVQSLLAPYAATVAVAALNGPKNTVISGRADDVQSLAKIFQAKGVETRPLHVSHAFHSPLVDPMLDEFERTARTVKHQAPSIDLVLNATGHLADETTPLDAAYWRRHARGTVRFAESVRALRARGITSFLEIAPSPVLLGLARQCVPEGECTWLPSLRRDHEAWPQLLRSLGELFVAGAMLNWRKFETSRGRNRPTLPTYPFQRERFWLPEDKPSAARSPANLTAGVHPLLGASISLAGRTGEYLWQGGLSLATCPWIDDHRVQGVAIVPATAYVEMAIAAAVDVAGEPPVVLTKIEIEKPLLLHPGTEFETQTRLEGAATEPMAFQIFSRPRGEKSAWTLHARGLVKIGTTGRTPARLDPATREAWKKNATNAIDGPAFYRLHHERGNEWGPLFQGLSRVWQSPGEALSEITPPAGIRAEIGRFLFHPALSDSSGHVLTATIPLKKSSGPRGGAFVGAGIEDICFYRRPQGDRLWAHARLRDPQDGPPNTLIGDVWVHDETGEIISETRGARLWYLDSAQKRGGLEPVEACFYEPRWVAGSSEAKPAPAAKDAGTWIVFRDRQGVGDALGARLRARGSECLYVDSAPPTASTPDSSLVINPRQSEGYATVLAAARKMKMPVRGIVHLWSLDAADPKKADLAAVQQAEVLGSQSVLRLVQALEAAPAAALKLWLVTRGAQPAADSPAPLAILQAPLWGLGRTIAVEKSDLWGGQIDLDPADPATTAAQQIVGQLTQAGGEDQVAFRRGQTKVLRLARLVAPTGRPAQQVIRSDGTYLVTGGLGGIGLEFARWLARHGARHLVLASRSAVPAREKWDQVASGSPEASRIAAVRSLEQLGATVRTFATDLGSEPAVRRLIEECRQAGQPPLRGVFHAAGVMQYEALSTQTPDQLSQVLAAKVTGGWTLHRLLADVPLDLFVLFSSSSSLLSSPLMGGYSAANVFLDALGHHRRALGLPAISLNWGTWSEAGMATRFQSAEESKRQGRSGATKGIGTLTNQRAFEAWERLIDSGVPQAGIMPIDWDQWQQAYGGLAATPYLSLLVKPPARPAAELDAGRARRDSILQASPESRRAPVELYLAEQMSVILKVSLPTIEADKSIAGLGFDSLMSIELKNKIEADLRVSVPMARLIQGPTLTELAGMILELLKTEPVGDSSARPVAAADEFEEGSL